MKTQDSLRECHTTQSQLLQLHSSIVSTTGVKLFSIDLQLPIAMLQLLQLSMADSYKVGPPNHSVGKHNSNISNFTTVYGRDICCQWALDSKHFAPGG